MKRLLLFGLLLSLCACAAAPPAMNDIADPAAPFMSGLYAFEPTLENAVANSTHIATLSLQDTRPYDKNRCLFTFRVESLLAGELDEETILVLGYQSFYVEGETYLLFLNRLSLAEWPQDIFTSFHLFTFRVKAGEEIDCLQQVANPETGEKRTFAQPFKDPGHNKLSFLADYMKKRAVKESVPAPENCDLDYLLVHSDLIALIVPLKREPVNPFIDEVEFTVSACHRGVLGEKTLALPAGLETGQGYLVFLREGEDGGYSLTARLSIFSLQSDTYRQFVEVWPGD